MVERNLISALNWAIQKDEPLHQVLKGLAGKTIRVVFPVGFHFDWFIEADGLLSGLGLTAKDKSFGSLHQAASADSSSLSRKPDVTIAIEFTGKMRVEGDAMVAEKLGPLLTLMKTRFSPIEKFWNESPAGLFAKQAADYAVYEANVVISRRQAEDHLQALRKFRERIDRLEKRLDQFERTRSL